MPETTEAPPPWLLVAARRLDQIAACGHVAASDVDLILDLLRSVEHDRIPAPNIAAYHNGVVQAWWASANRHVSALARGGVLDVARYVTGGEPVRPPGHPAARLRDDLEWLYPRLVGPNFTWQIHEDLDGGIAP